MEISCPYCNSNYNIDPKKIPGKSTKLLCPRCKIKFQPVIDREKEEFIFEADTEERIKAGLNSTVSVTSVIDMIDTHAFGQEVDYIGLWKEDKEIIPFLNETFQNAVKYNTENIHFKNLDNTIRVFFRVDGQLYLVDEIPKKYREALNGKIKDLAGLDRLIVDRAQSNGKIRFEHTQNQSIWYSVSTLPTHKGEDLILSSLGVPENVTDLALFGVHQNQIELLNKLILSRAGMIVIGGGNTVIKNKIMVALGRLAMKLGLNIFQLDPAEKIGIDSDISKIKLSPERDFNLDTALGFLMEMDLDVLLYPEIDVFREPAYLLIESSLSSYLVITSLRAPDFATGLFRMQNNDISLISFLSSVKVLGDIYSLPKICPFCKVADEIMKKEDLELDEKTENEYFIGAGCDKCNNTGYRGFSHIFDIFETTPNLSSELLKIGDFLEMKKHLYAIRHDQLLSVGLEKCKQGEITFDDLMHLPPFRYVHKSE